MHKISLVIVTLLSSSVIVWGVHAGSASVKSDASFTFASIADAHVETANFTQTINQIDSLSPNFILFAGDVENDGVVTSEMDPMIGVLKNAGLFTGTFIVRGNHDDLVTGSAALWQTYFSSQFGGSIRPLPAGVSNYVAIDSTSSYLSYSFDYGNSRFIGIDVPGDADLLTSAEYTFLDNRLSNAESMGLTHAFIFFHGPEYCVESEHCDCSTRTDSSCTPSDFITLINKYPIVSATFHGHEHVLGHVHMDNTRIAALTHPYEEFLTSSAGEPYTTTMYPDRIDDNYYSSSLSSFGMVSVNGNDFTVSFYHTGNSSPVWSRTFTNPYHPRNPSTTTLISSLPNPSVVGQLVTINYNVVATPPGSGTPTGNVTVSDGTQTCTGTVQAGSCSIPFATAGAKTLIATYAGDAYFSGSASSPGTAHTVNQANTTTTITSDLPDPSVVGQSITVSYSVSVTSPGSGTPTGSVTVSDGTQSRTGSVQGEVVPSPLQPLAKRSLPLYTQAMATLVEVFPSQSLMT
jgi:hypothetical protein